MEDPQAEPSAPADGDSAAPAGPGPELVSPTLVVQTLRTALENEGRWTPLPRLGASSACVHLPGWRVQIIAWLREVASDFFFSFETLCVSVNYFDR